jgi:hypothetical protein
VTVRDSLAHSPTTDLPLVADALAATLPVGRTIKITPEVIEAATAGDVALLVTLFAAEVQPDEAELAALQEGDNDGSRASIADTRRERFSK